MRTLAWAFRGLLVAAVAHAQEPEVVRGYYVTAGASQLTDYGDSQVAGFNFGAGKDLFATPYLRGGLQLDSHIFRTSDLTVHNTSLLLTLRAVIGSAMMRPYGEVGVGYVTVRSSDFVPLSTEFSLGFEFQAGTQTAYLGYSNTQSEEPMHSLKLGMRIP